MGPVRNVVDQFPWEVAIVPGIVLFALTWLVPWRIITLPATGSRRKILLWVGAGGSVLVVAVASIMSWINLVQYELTGFDGWWRRPAPLVAALLIIAVTAVVLRREPLPAPGERAIAPRRSWRAFAPGPLLWGVGIVGALILVTTLWQILIATSAPEEGPFVGRIREYTSLPIFTDFNAGTGYAPGAGWPNHLATLLTVLLAAGALILFLRADANTPLPAQSSPQAVRVGRDATARVVGLVLLAALITTLGAVWMHVGLSGQTAMGYDQVWVSEDTSITGLNVSGSYSGIARELNLTGYLLQGIGVALALRIAVDTLRAYRAPETTSTHPKHTIDTSKVAW